MLDWTKVGQLSLPKPPALPKLQVPKLQQGFPQLPKLNTKVAPPKVPGADTPLAGGRNPWQTGGGAPPPISTESGSTHGTR